MKLLLHCRLLWCIAHVICLHVSLDDDPSLWPGHLEPFGSKQKTIDVDVLDEYPSPQAFFQDYVDKSRPVLFRGLAKRSPAYSLWDDSYIKNLIGAESDIVYVESELKENRTKYGFKLSLKDFINTYRTKNIYMVDGIPESMRKDVVLPAPLRCEESRPLLLDSVMWFSAGGTKSVLHNDDLDNINCLFRGSKDLLFISYEQNKNFVPIDRPQGGYSSLDVDKVDFNKFPQLRRVDQYVRAKMNEGDCLFIPYKWFHQVNSFANSKGQNVAVNIWFKHLKYHVPKKCEIPELDADLNKFKFADLAREKYGEGDKNQESYEGDDGPPPTLLQHFEGYLSLTKKKRANFITFYHLLCKDSVFAKFEVADMVDHPPHVKDIAKEIFTAMNLVDDAFLTKEDFDVADLDDKREVLEEFLVKKTSQLENELQDAWEKRNQRESVSVPREATEATAQEEAKMTDKSEL